MSERFFILTPTPTGRTVEVPGCGVPAIFLDASGNEMKWGGKNALPAINDRVYVSMNSLGYAKVVGYLESHGWLGIMVAFENPPDWHKKQTRANAKNTAKPQWVRDGIGCVFGVEFRLEK